jgi:hypothetical protein
MEIGERLRAVASEYENVKAAAEAAVGQWRWYTGGIVEYCPFWFERHGVKRGRRIDQPGRVRCGLDPSGTQVFIEQDGGGERFLLYLPESGIFFLESVLFDAEGKLVNLRRRGFVNHYSRLLSYEEATVSGSSIRTTIETYTYDDARIYPNDGDRIVRIDVRDGRDACAYAVTYDVAGVVEIRMVEPARAPAPLYERPELSASEERFRALSTQYEQLKAAADAAVVRREAYDGYITDIGALSVERHDFGTGRPARRPEESSVLYGFDASGR